jgi:MATE family multidrug resistance protein
VAIGLSWPLMVIPTYLVWRNGLGVETAWGAATVYVAATAGVFALRFRGGKWRTMKVIEATVADPDGPTQAEETPAKLPAA